MYVYKHEKLCSYGHIIKHTQMSIYPFLLIRATYFNTVSRTSLLAGNFAIELAKE